MANKTKNERDIEYISETQTLVGTKKRELWDRSTGEVFTVDQITKLVYGTKQFWKIYLMDFLAVLGVFDSKQVDVFIYIVENTDPSTNLFLGTYKAIANGSGCTQPTVAQIMKKLRAQDFVRKVQNGAYYVNPNILMKGNDTKRQMLLTYYRSTDENVNGIEVKRERKKGFDDQGQLEGQLSIDDVK